jgi:hypothetical protein
LSDLARQLIRIRSMTTVILGQRALPGFVAPCTAAISAIMSERSFAVSLVSRLKAVSAPGTKSS